MREKWNPPLKERMLQYIKDNPGCVRKDMYSLCTYDATIRAYVIMFKNRKLIKTRKCECGNTEYLEVA